MGYSIFAPTIASIPGLQDALDAHTSAIAAKASNANAAMTGRLSLTGTMTDSTAPGLLLDQTWNGGAYAFTGLALRVTNTASVAGGYLMNLSVDSTPRFSVYQEGCIRAQGSTLTSARPIGQFSTAWNNAGVTFTGLLLNVTDTASASASKLLDLQVGGTSKFYVDKEGIPNLNYEGIRVSSSVDAGTETRALVGTGAGANGLFAASSGGMLGFTAGTSATAPLDGAFQRVAAGVLGVCSGVPGTYRDLRLRALLDTNGAQVVGTRGAAVADATDSTDVITRFNELLARFRATGGHGLISDT
jgi:hypothetical protein